MQRLSTGNAPLDRILGGGLPRHSINIVMGLPGTGKTILAEQLAFANGSAERPVIYLTTVSEPIGKVVSYLQEMKFADVDRLGTEIIYDSLVDLLRERPGTLTDRVADLIERYRPSVIVIDSFKALLELAPNPSEWRNTVFDLGSLFAAYDVLGVWVGEYEHASIAQLPEFAIADGIIELRRVQSGSRDDRYLQVIKLRGSSFHDGEHAFILGKDGITVFPRLIGPPLTDGYDVPTERLQTGIAGLDSMIESGWLRGTSTLVLGPSGAGKSMLALHFLRHGALSDEPGLLVSFQETPSQLRRAVTSLGWDPKELLRPDRLDVLYTSPVELQIDTIIRELITRIEKNGVRRVVIDALGDLEKSAGSPARFVDYVYALSQDLTHRGITSMLVLESAGVEQEGRIFTRQAVSYVSDNIVVLSMEVNGELVRTVRIVKTRASAHDSARHVLRISREGILVEDAPDETGYGNRHG
jgi:circadian clock protein KaiC